MNDPAQSPTDKSIAQCVPSFLQTAQQVSLIDISKLDPRKAIHRLSSLAQGRGMKYDMVREAAGWAVSAQKTMKSMYGDLSAPTYPLAVANSVVMLNLDQSTSSKAESVVAALLHDAVANNIVTLADIRISFGDGAAILTDEVARITRMGRQLRLGKELSEDDFSFNQAQFEVAQEALCSLPRSSRVVPIKLFDCLHSMRTLDFDKTDDGRMRRALFADGTYIPIARYYGWDGIRKELQDLVMRAVDPVAQRRIKESMDFYRRDVDENGRPQILNRIENQVMQAYGVNRPIEREIEVSGRIKEDYPVWKKMRRRQSEATQARIKDARRLGVPLSDERRTFTYTIRPDNFDALYVGIHDRIGFRIKIVDGTDADTIALANGLRAKIAQIPNSTDNYIEKPRDQGRRGVPYIAYHQGFYRADEKLGVVPFEAQIYKSSDAMANYNDHSAYKGRKGLIVPEVPPHLVQRRRGSTGLAVAFQNANLVSIIAGRTANRMTGGELPLAPYTPLHIVTVGKDGAFIPLRVKDGADPSKPEYPTIGDFIFTLHSGMAAHVVEAVVEGKRWDLRQPPPTGVNPMDYNLMTGDRIVLVSDDDYYNLTRYKGHLRSKRSREALSGLLKLNGS